MDFQRKNVHLIRKAITILDESNFLANINLNIRGTALRIVGPKRKPVEFCVTYGCAILNGVFYPSEYSLRFRNQDHSVKVQNGKIICNLRLLEKLVDYLEL